MADERIRVNAVRPGFTYTDTHASGVEPNHVDRMKARVPMKRRRVRRRSRARDRVAALGRSFLTTGAFIDVSGGM